MKIEIFGMGCPKCLKLMENAKQAAAALSLNAQVEKVSDMQEILKKKILSTPALAVDGKVLSMGKLMTVDEIEALLK